jgi:hypothetical protein
MANRDWLIFSGRHLKRSLPAPDVAKSATGYISTFSRNLEAGRNGMVAE